LHTSWIPTFPANSSVTIHGRVCAGREGDHKRV
jgi:hypothetical protein